jgi:hypothetical protein
MSAKGETITRWKAFSKLWLCYNEYNTRIQMHKCYLNQVFANRSKEEEIFHLTTKEIAEAQKTNDKLKHCFNCNVVMDKGLEVGLVDNTHVVCKEGGMLIPKLLQWCAVLGYHHYLRQPGHTHLEETMNAIMYWKGMRTTIRSIMKSCNHAKSIRNGNLSTAPSA